MSQPYPESFTLESSSGRAVEPFTLVIFGASGDLARRKLVPALYNLMLDGLLPPNFAVLGVGRKPITDEEFRSVMREAIIKYSRRPLAERIWSGFEERLFYIAGSADEPDSFHNLKTSIEKIEGHFNLPGNRLYYLAVPPSTFIPTVQGLWQAGLVHPPDPKHPYCRLVVEKPIGHDLQSAREINAAIGAAFHESQIFRIDHYLGKETVQNIMVLRFANSIFEPLWNNKYIDHVQMTVSEVEGVGTRGAYYEGTGALRDMVQNHILQLLCLVAMEPPHSLDPDVVRDARMDVLRALRPIAGKDVERFTVRAQYTHGTVQGMDALRAAFGLVPREIPGYRHEPGVSPHSTTETFVALKLYLENWRWAGLPFYLRTGKALPKRASEIAVQFKDTPQILFNTNPATPLAPNLLALRIQPEEGMSLRIVSKIPGTRAQTHPVEMNFKYGETYGGASPEAYERLLLDVMIGDASLFMRRDAVEASWAWVTPILEGWQTYGTSWLPEYPAGAWGPVEADRLIQSDGRAWRTL
jgi:glucose-6-phosphate 1-dehydrogenase